MIIIIIISRLYASVCAQCTRYTIIIVIHNTIIICLSTRQTILHVYLSYLCQCVWVCVCVAYAKKTTKNRAVVCKICTYKDVMPISVVMIVAGHRYNNIMPTPFICTRCRRHRTPMILIRADNFFVRCRYFS